MIVPDSVADRIKDDALKAVIIANRPVSFGAARERGHDNAGQMQVPHDQCDMWCFRQVETASDLGFPFWIRWFQSHVLVPHGMAYNGMHTSADAADMTAWQ